MRNVFRVRISEIVVSVCGCLCVVGDFFLLLVLSSSSSSSPSPLASFDTPGDSEISRTEKKRRKGGKIEKLFFLLDVFFYIQERAKKALFKKSQKNVTIVIFLTHKKPVRNCLKKNFFVSYFTWHKT